MEEPVVTVEGKPIKKLIKYEILYAKAWADDTGRNMAGEMEGTLVGIFPKLQLEIGSCNEEEFSELLRIFNAPTMNVTYYDTELRDYMTAPYYADDVTTSLQKQRQMKYYAYQVTLHPIRRR